jgi:hypothetical protein
MELVHSFFLSPLWTSLISNTYTFHLDLVTWSARLTLLFSTFSLSLSSPPSR